MPLFIVAYRPFFYESGIPKFSPQHALNKTSQVGPTRPEGAEAPSPGQRPGYNSNQHGAL